MTQLTASDFPALHRVFAGYLHEDLFAEHGGPAAALRAFNADASAAERRRFNTEARRFIARTETLPFNDVCALLAQLGCRWVPPSREALAAALTGAVHLPTDSPDT